MNIKQNIEKAVKTVREADALLITAGAGIGVDSGLPDFRGNTGFWKAYPAIAKLGKSFAEMANPAWFKEDPRLAWAFYGHRLNLYRQTTPHEGFYQLIETAKNKKGGYFVFTSNVDGQFQKAGYDSNHIEECHGSLHHLQCTTPCSMDIWDAKDTIVKVDMDNFRTIGNLPHCSYCGDVARPNILMFGDAYWISNRSESQSERLEEWLTALKQNSYKLVIIEIGAGNAVPTVRWTSQNISKQHDATLIRINPRDFNVTGGNISLPMGAKDGIAAICNS